MYKKKAILALSHKICSNPKQNSTEGTTAAAPAAFSVFPDSTLTIHDSRDLVRSQPGTACVMHCYMAMINNTKSASVSCQNRSKKDSLV